MKQAVVDHLELSLVIGQSLLYIVLWLAEGRNNDCGICNNGYYYCFYCNIKYKSNLNFPPIVLVVEPLKGGRVNPHRTNKKNIFFSMIQKILQEPQEN